MIYFTADLHFYHDKIIKHVNRPFRSTEDMNKTLVKKWNAKITPSDEVYILGDFTMKGPELAMEVLSKLRGKKHLIKGNHDRFVDQAGFNESLFDSVRDYAEMTYENTKLILFHYPVLEWNGFYRDSISLHGHQHNNMAYNFDNLQKGIRRFDVGVDANMMAPVSAEDIIAFFQLIE